MDTLVPSALLNLPRSVKDYVRGVNSPIAYVVNVVSGSWLPYLGSYEPQKYLYDTNECSQLSGINVAETICNWLKAKNRFSPQALQWFRDNGYFDENDSFAFSERFAGILSGTTIKGNSGWNFWVATGEYGFLPRKDLNYNYPQSTKFMSQEAMCNDYYNHGVVTAAMYAKAKESKKYLQVNYEWVGIPDFNKQTPTNDIIAALKQSPLQIGVPVCLPAWNNNAVPLCNRLVADHAVELYGQNPDGSWLIRDHYDPSNKVLPAAYFIPHAVKGVITALNPVPVDSPPTPPASLAADANKAPNQVELGWFLAMLKWLGARFQWVAWKKQQ